MRNLDQPIVVIVAIFSCCRCTLLWSCCGGSWCDWFEGLPVQAGDGTPLSCSACPVLNVRLPIARRTHHVLLHCLRWSFLEQKAKNTIPSIQYIFPCIMLSLCFFLLCIATLYLQCINSFYYYLSLLLCSSSSSSFYSHYVVLGNLWIHSLFSFLRPIATTSMDLDVDVYISLLYACIYSMWIQFEGP